MSEFIAEFERCCVIKLDFIIFIAHEEQEQAFDDDPYFLK